MAQKGFGNMLTFYTFIIKFGVVRYVDVCVHIHKERERARVCYTHTYTHTHGLSPYNSLVAKFFFF